MPGLFQSPRNRVIVPNPLPQSVSTMALLKLTSGSFQSPRNRVIVPNVESPSIASEIPNRDRRFNPLEIGS